jgi:hypothetical protein
MHTCMPHSYYIYGMHTYVMQTAHTYSACMHTIPTYAGYLVLLVYFKQNTCKHFPRMHKLMLHSHKPFPCTLHRSTLHPHTMPLTSRTFLSLLCVFRMCLCACCLCLQRALWQYSCMEHVLMQLRTCMWHACTRDASVQCMRMHVGGMHACSERLARVCGVNSCGI